MPVALRLARRLWKVEFHAVTRGPLWENIFFICENIIQTHWKILKPLKKEYKTSEIQNKTSFKKMSTVTKILDGSLIKKKIRCKSIKKK